MKKQTIVSTSLVSVTNANRGTRMSLLQAIFMIFFGVCLAGLVLEVVLWIAGGYLTNIKGRTVSVTKEDAKRIRIVAIGESTTAPLTGPAWPEYLEQELNRRVGHSVYRVYNLGVSGSNSSAIYRRLMTEAMTLRPDIVISMMGVNDIKYLALPASAPTLSSRIGDFIQSTRSYKFLAIISRLLGGQRKRALTETALSCRGDELGDNMWQTQSLPAYEAIIQKIYPDRYVGQFSNGPKDQIAELVLREFLQKYPFSYQAYEVLVDHFASRSMWNEVVIWTKNYRDIQPLIHSCVMVNPTISLHSKDVMVRHVEDIGVFMDSLSVISERMVKEKIGGDWAYYEAIKAQVGAKGKPSNFNTAEIYRKIYQYLSQKHIRYIAMQYPLLSVRTLQDMFPYDSNVTFVSNEMNFQNLLKTGSYDDVFVDNFAGVFGHTTQLGSQLIASSAADAVMSVLPPKK